MVKIKGLNNQRGVAAIVVGVCLLMFLGFAALAVDVGYVMVSRNELQNIADAAALAGARKLGTIYEPMSLTEIKNYVCDRGTIVSIVKDVAQKNQTVGLEAPFVVNDTDIKIGTWNPDLNAKPRLTETLVMPDAVRVTVRRDTTTNNSLATLFARILGNDAVDVSAVATAALTGDGTAEPGSVIPVGISSQWFRREPNGGFCGKVIQFYPTSEDSCAGWHTFERDPASESYLRKTILEGWIEGSFPPVDSTPYKIGDEFVFTGGTLGNQTFTAFLALFDYMKTRDNDLDPTAWTTKVVVYEDDDCRNPSGEMTVEGFATAIITAVGTPPNQTISASVICDNVDPGRGSGGPFGTKGSIPGLVQ